VDSPATQMKYYGLEFVFVRVANRSSN